MLRLLPRPDTLALFRYYPRGYWFNPNESAASQWAERYRRLVVRDHVGFVSQVYRSAGGSGALLDVGCGGGLLPGMLRERGVPAVGIDFSSEACSLAWRRHRVPAVTGDLASFPFGMGLFRVITMFHVLEHLPDPGAYLAAAHKLLGPDGRLVVQVPNAGSWQFRVLGKRWNGLDIPRHLNDFRAEDLRLILERNGFAVVREKHFSWRDNPAGLATSLAPALDPMARRLRGVPTGWIHLGVYFGLVVAAIPFALAESVFKRGSTIMLEARKR